MNCGYASTWDMLTRCGSIRLVNGTHVLAYPRFVVFPQHYAGLPLMV